MNLSLWLLICFNLPGYVLPVHGIFEDWFIWESSNLPLFLTPQSIPLLAIPFPFSGCLSCHYTCSLIWISPSTLKLCYLRCCKMKGLCQLPWIINRRILSTICWICGRPCIANLSLSYRIALLTVSIFVSQTKRRQTIAYSARYCCDQHTKIYNAPECAV